jgi:hypothetical protein
MGVGVKRSGPRPFAIAFARAVETASREENAAKQWSRALLSIPSKAKML